MIPIRLEVVAVGVGRATVDKHEHRQIFGVEFSWRINQHAFNRCAIVGFPLVGLALREIALGKKLVECGDRAGVFQLFGALGEINFRGLF